MKTNYEVRYSAHPEDAKHYDTARLRRDFLIETIFTSNEVNMVYSMYDRMVVGGAMPAGEALKLEAIDSLKSDYFTTRREIGIYNVGGAGSVKVGDEVVIYGKLVNYQGNTPETAKGEAYLYSLNGQTVESTVVNGMEIRTKKDATGLWLKVDKPGVTLFIR